MLQIAFSQIQDKHKVILREGSIFVPVGKGVLIQGDSKTITKLFMRILYQKQCTFSLDEEVLTKEILQHNITLLTKNGSLPLLKKVKHIFSEIGYSVGQCENLLRSIHLEHHLHHTIYRLTREERILLSVQFACASHARVLLLDNDFSKISISCQEQITVLLQNYMVNGNFLIATQGAKQSLPNCEVYEIIGQALSCKHEHLSNFFEEKGMIEKQQKKKTSKFTQFKDRLSFLSILKTVGFCAYSSIVVSVLLFMIFALSFEIEQFENNKDILRVEGEYSMRINGCSYETSAGQYCNDKILSKEQINKLYTIEGIKNISPVHNLWFTNGGLSSNQTMKIIADGEIIPVKEDTNLYYSYISAMDNSLIQVHKTFQYGDDTTRGIYISEQLAQEYKDIFGDGQNKEIFIQGMIETPIYIQSINARTYNGYTSQDVMQTNIVTRPFAISFAVLGTVNDSSSPWYMDEQVFLDIQKEALTQYPKEHLSSTMGFSDPLDDYEPMDYQVTVQSYDDLAIVQSKIQESDPMISVINDILQQEETIETTKLVQKGFRETLTPILCILMVISAVFIGIHGRFQKQTFLFTLQRQNISRSWITKRIWKTIGIGFGIFLCSFLLLSIISKTNIMEFSNKFFSSQHFDSINIFENQFFNAFAISISTAKTLITMPFVILTLFVISLSMSILHDLQTYYFLYKSKKLF